ncbi:vomeronasal type-2 receptor 26-like [Hyperolius riggenbachi]|uniref:vomeronasal type-2 receptor 26-like n=1 Tax=Hyperolius riggenbachi TaxID=752182 RepID=UPI0035A2B454
MAEQQATDSSQCGDLRLPYLQEYGNILTFIFTINEINKDFNLLPNITLGYHLYDTCADPKKSVRYALKILSGHQQEAPNYSCMKNGEIAGFVGDSGFTTTLALSQLLSLYRYTQIGFQVTDPLLSDRKTYPNYYRTIPDDRLRYAATVKCLEHFGWNWIGMITPHDGSGETELQELTKLMNTHSICLEFVVHLSANMETNRNKMEVIENSTTEVVIICGLFSLEYAEMLVKSKALLYNMTVITNESWKMLLNSDHRLIHSFNCSLQFQYSVNFIPGLKTFINKKDSENCHKCSDEEWPDERKENCIPKTYDFLSYENDILVLVFAIITLIFSLILLLVLGVFTFAWNTPIVKANNRTVSFILLTSILLSFLCVFLFLGHPVDITCKMRKVLYGICFSISLSSVLAKTIQVCIVFKASKPGSSWKKWISAKVSYYVVLSCSSVQLLNCIIWLSTSPPYQEYDMYYSPGKIIIQCNEGSVIGFYSVLGYMGFLAAVSFLLAFMVRTLPDSFNEAKYITFSMLVFCSVWIAMIPAYLSTRGKYMVAVEVFAILVSSAGILGCIFFPKIYIILVKPYLNCRQHMLMKNKHFQ